MKKAAEPQSWADILKQRESERNNPPDQIFYKKERIVKHEEGGIFGEEPTGEFLAEYSVPIDTSIYSSTFFFEDEQKVEPRSVKPSRDHGLDLVSWSKKPRAELDTAKKNSIRADYQHSNRDFDIISGQAKCSQFKSTINEILRQKESSQKILQTRSFDPISNTFPTDGLEMQRSEQETIDRAKYRESYLSRMPSNERRAKESMINIITGETKDEDLSRSLIHEFASTNINRNRKAMKLEEEIVQNREITATSKNKHVSCRYNTNGRLNELRDFDIITGQSKSSNLDFSVRMKPSIWEWCQEERIVIDESKM